VPVIGRAGRRLSAAAARWTLCRSGRHLTNRVDVRRRRAGFLPTVAAPDVTSAQRRACARRRSLKRTRFARLTRLRTVVALRTEAARAGAWAAGFGGGAAAGAVPGCCVAHAATGSVD